MKHGTMKRRTLLVGAVVAAAAVVSVITVTAAQSSPSNASSYRLVIGNLAELTGSMSPFGAPMVKAGNVAVAVANRAAKQAKLGITVRQAVADAQGDPQAALQAARTLVGQGASCLTGPAVTGEAIAIAQGLTIQRKIPLWPQATSVRLRTINDKGTVFRTTPPDSLQAKALAQGIRTALGGANGKTVSVAYRNEPYGEGLSRDFSAAWRKMGGKIQGPVVFDPAAASYDSEARKIVDNNPNAFLILDFPDTYAKMGAALVRTGRFDARKAWVPDAMAFATVPANIPAQSLEGARGTVAGTPTRTALYKAFDREWKRSGKGGHFSLDTNEFDATMTCILASVAANSNKPAAIRANIRRVANPGGKKYTFTQLAAAMRALRAGRDINYVGVSSQVDLDKRGDPITGLYDIFAFRNGKLVTLRQINVK